jgi:hypothetical protein
MSRHSHTPPTSKLRRSLRRAAVATVAAAALAVSPVPAHAVSTADIVQLAQAGLSDEVLIALIQTDNTVYPLDAPRILELREAGVSEAVIVAMLRNGRRPPDRAASVDDGWTPAYEPPLEPTGVMYDGYPPAQVPSTPAPSEEARVAPSVVYLPYPVVTTSRGGRHQTAPAYRGFGRFINDGFGRFINDGWVERGGTHRTRP